MSTTLENQTYHHLNRSHGMSRTKILTVDDDVEVTDIVKLTLERNDNYDVCIENDPRMATATARKFWPDIVLLDVLMPELDGTEVHQQFMADPILKHIPIIFLTAIVRQKEVDEHKGIIGGSFYIAKPMSADQLSKAIEEHVLFRQLHKRRNLGRI